jgi:hypothetical protein
MEKGLEYLRLIDNQYNYLKSCVNSEGQMVDKKLKAPLNFQYHYTSFILSSILKQDYEKLDKVLNYYFSISTKIMKPSNDFNIVILSFALLNDKDNILNKNKNKIIESIYHNTDKELFKLNNNFRALRLVGIILENKIKNINLTQNIYDEIDWILNLQFDDGFFPDSNMEYEVYKNQGVPHLTYHTKIMMCVGIAYLYTQDDRLKKSFFKAMNVLLDISTDNYYFFYGRSTNALFGYGSLYISFILAYSFSSNELFMNQVNKLMKFLRNYQHNDGHISINLNKNDSLRVGFDGYMYDIVYNAYSNALFLLGNEILKNNRFKKELINLENNKLHVYKNSGFVIYKNNNIKYCFNYKGHQDSLKHKFDSRVSPFSLLYYSIGDINLLPSVAFIQQPILKLVETKFPFKKLYNKIYRYLYFDWLPILSGNSFFFIKNKIKFYPYKCIKMIKFRNKIIMKFEARSREIFLKKNLLDFFVISIDLKDQLVYKLFFYEFVDTLYYTYREIENKQKFNYSFDKQFKTLRTIKVETSHLLADLYRIKINNLNRLNIKVGINEKIQ